MLLLRHLLRTVVWFVRLILFLVVLYLGTAGVFLGLTYLQKPPSDKTSKTVTIYVFADYFHADLILPIDATNSDWDYLFKSYNFSQNRENIRYISVGWGSQAFYLGMRQWDNLNAGIVLKALAFDQSVLHIAAWQSDFAPQPSLYAVSVTQAGYAKILQFVRDSFAKDPQNHAQVIPSQKYWDNDAFFKAHGRYHPLRTCNQWTAEALRLAGVPVPYWSPFAAGLIWTLPNGLI